MPLGFERINARTLQPNALINFIRPLPGPDEEHSRDFLSRIAAQCYPIMKGNHTAVMALAEHEWNPEFAGRNFNAGELIELVLRGKSGQWLPFKHVQLVMMHELAHCKEMNHSSSFWKVRNAYCEEVKVLWDRDYVGEGMWGRGRAIDGRFVEGQSVAQEDLPEHVCSGTYRRQGRGRKRKRRGEKLEKPKISYAERQQKRILNKFGSGGKKLGDDEDARVKLEEGKKQKAKPRVAGSARGRDLRAAAALARFETVKKEEVIKEEETHSDTESDDDWHILDDDAAATDRDGKKITDAQGHGMVRVCGAEDENDEDVKREMEELRMTDIPPAFVAKGSAKKPALELTYDSGTTTESESDAGELTKAPKLPSSKGKGSLQAGKPSASASRSTESEAATSRPPPISQKPRTFGTPSPKASGLASAPPDSPICLTCSFENADSDFLCMICSNVLKPNIMRNTWKCRSKKCEGSFFINHDDSGRCAVCGGPRE
ncbi:WLM-domain-containing protein [Venturia nashicola]|uniref:WLM-domain-containing protein n=1 Tax=Venturia nashicola TaxID=86259 RepID=A0A4Z1P291_9PEZI|nr:WLM-domain-containing protein [Venturia nashicola]TLD20209.1 WLM-domain-containing protein [Venturia nashicola]